MPEAVTRSLEMTTPPHDVDTVHDVLADVWRATESIDIEDRFRFEVALIELASNVMKHADPGTGVSCTLVIEATADRIQATLSDSGLPGNVRLTDREMPGPEAESGRGIPLIQQLVDELSYERADGKNHWRIVSTPRGPSANEGVAPALS